MCSNLANLTYKDFTLSIQHSKTKLIKSFSYTFQVGKIYGIIGKSGAGKSILCHSLVKLPRKSQILQRGKILFFQQDTLYQTDISTHDPHFDNVFRKKVTYLTQDPAFFFNPVIKLCTHAQEMGTSGLQDMLRYLDLDAHVLDLYSHQLSGGMLQKLQLALSLCSPNKQFFFLDEPLSSLDATSCDKLATLLHQRKKDICIIIVSHNLSFIEQFTDEILLLEQGKLLDAGQTNSFFRKSTACQILLNPAPLSKFKQHKQSSFLLKIEGVSFVKSNTTILDNCSLTICLGDRIGIKGVNGSGKTTLSKIFTRVIKPTSGHIFVSPGLRPFMLFQSPHTSLNPEMSVFEALAEASKAKSMSMHDLRNLLKQLHLDHINLDQSLRNLSLGEKQRLSIARMALFQPNLLICDEITASLDLPAMHSVMNLISQMYNVFNFALVFISHNEIALKHMCQNILMLENGHLHSVLDHSAPDKLS